VLALQYLLKGGRSNVFNLGSEDGFSVREIIETAKKVTGKDFKVVEEKRRAGDPAILIASSAKIKQELGWQPKHSTTQEIIATAWKWHMAHPEGYTQA
jgi:UDP-glucose 4-epimerase